jgi:3-deoxy-manno-octulosonate cytidylyltransferase (CMP-KDO synthetase)
MNSLFSDWPDFLVVIPARMGGSRLPGKPLVEIAGKPLIQHVAERALEVVGKNEVFVLTEDQEIEEFCGVHGFNVFNTGSAPTAIDRIAMFAKEHPAKRYINVQGDEPIFNLDDLGVLVKLDNDLRHKVVFGKTQVLDDFEFYDHSKAKVVCAKDGRLIYSSRAGIPITNSGSPGRADRAIWLYSFPFASLERYLEFGLGDIESIEDNEIIRFLEIGESVYCIDMIGDSWAVDEPKDVEIVERLMEGRVSGHG